MSGPRTTALALWVGLLSGPLAAQVTTAPALGPAPRLVVPAVQRFALPNGLRVEVVERHEVPLVQAALRVRGGGRLDGNMPGLATFTADMLDEGVAGRDAFALAAELESLGAQLRTTASWETFALDVNAPTRTFGRALGVLADVALRPSFASTDVNRQRQLRLARLLQARDEPEDVARLVLVRTVYGEGHPYHQPLTGDSAATVALDSATVRDFWARAADPRRATLYRVGDVTPAAARQLATQAFGGWKPPSAPVPLAPPTSVAEAPRPATHLVLVDKPGAVQSVIIIGAPGVARTSPDYPAIMVMSTLLGGSFSSRLNDILREQKGFTYGARATYQWRPVPGPFVAMASVRTDVTDSSLAIFFQEFTRLRTEPVTPVELERARQYLVLGTLADFEADAQVAEQLTSLDEFGLPLATLPAELDAMRRVTVAEVQRAAEAHLDPAHLSVVVVGDLATIRPSIERLGLGPIEVRDVEGR